MVEEHTYRPLAGAKLLLEQNGQTVSQRLVNRFGVYSGFKVLRGNYLLKAMLPHYQFPYSSEHQRLNVSTNYYPQEITVRSAWQSLVVPVIYLTTVGDDGITPSLSKKQQILYQSNYYFWQASRYLAWLPTQLNSIDYFKFSNFASFILCNFSCLCAGRDKKSSYQNQLKSQ